MKKLALLICVCFPMAMAMSAQTPAPAKKAAPAGAGAASAGVASTGSAIAAAKLCQDPYQVGDHAEGWPEAPVYILYHREKSKLPWARNPAIRLPGIEAATASAARTLVCIEESQLEMGRYESGEPGYSPSWDVTLISLADRKVYFLKVGFYGKEPPGIKFNRGAGVGERPTKIFTDWLPLVVNQKVAKLKARFHSKGIEDIRWLVFSGDGARLAMAEQPRSTLGGTPPSPVTVVDVATGKMVATWSVDYIMGGLAISQSGDMVALGHNGRPEIWDVATSRLAHKLDFSGVESLLFGPNDALGVTGGSKAAVWDVKNERVLISGKGSRLALSPSGEWLTIAADAKSVTVQALQSGSTLATFPGISANAHEWAVAGDVQSMVKHGYGGVRMVASGASGTAASGASGPRDELSVQLPSLGVSEISALAAGRDRFVFGNGDGIVGLASVKNPQTRAFATDQSRITALAVSPDNKSLAVGDSSGVVTIWELQ